MHWQREKRNWPHAQASHFVVSGPLRWHVQSFGDPSKPVCLLLHGTGGATHSWSGLAPLLAERFHVLAPDLPGHGFTTRPRQSEGFSLPGYASSVAALLEGHGAEPALVIGHSAGAAVALQMHLDGGLPVRRIIGINAALMPFKGMVGDVFSMLAKALVINPIVPSVVSWGASERRIERLLESTGSNLPPEQVALYRRLFSSSDHVGAALAMMANWDLNPLKRRWHEVTCPVELITGDQDGTVPPSDAAEIVEKMPTARVHMLRGLGHLAHEEAPETVASLIFKMPDHGD